MVTNTYEFASDETLRNLFVDLVLWTNSHPNDSDARKRLEAIKLELQKRGVIV